MAKFLIRIKNTNSFDYLEYGNLPLIDGYYQSTISAEDMEQAAEIFGMGYDEIEEIA